MKPGIQSEKNQSLLSSAIIGGIAGGTEAIFSNPLVTIKSCLQRGIQIPWGSWFPSNSDASTIMRGAGKATRFLYRGANVRVMGISLSIGMRLWVRDVNVKYVFAGKHPSYYQEMFNSLSAGFLSSFIITPMELVMALQQVSNPHQKAQSLTKIFAEIRYDWGIKKSLTGFSLVALRDSIISSGFLTFAPTFKKYLCDNYRLNEHSATLLGGTGIGIVLSILTHPIDTVKTNQQANVRNSTDKNAHSITYAFNQVIKKNGINGLYKGLFFRACRVGPHVGIVTAVSEGITQFWENKRKKSSF